MSDARPKKRSLTLHGHRTSVSLEEPFWREFLRIAEETGKTINGLAAEIDDARLGGSGLATAIRLYVLASLQAQILLATKAPNTNAELPPTAPPTQADH